MLGQDVNLVWMKVGRRLTEPAAVRNNHPLLEWLRVERVVGVVRRHWYSSNIFAGHEQDIAVVLGGHRCRLEGLNVVQVRCFLAIHDLNTYDSLALVLKVSGAGILLCWESDHAKSRIVSR